MIKPIDKLIADYVAQIEILESIKNDINVLDFDDIEFALKKLKSVIKDITKKKPAVFETFI